jgi:hypothetical protein
MEYLFRVSQRSGLSYAIPAGVISLSFIDSLSQGDFGQSHAEKSLTRPESGLVNILYNQFRRSLDGCKLQFFFKLID